MKLQSQLLINLNRVTADKPVALRSVNGPQATTIDGGGQSVRCAYLINNASLSGFTLTNGNGAYGGTLTNCALTGNVSVAAYNCTLDNCTLSGNGAGAYGCRLNNCALTGNSGAGAYASTLNHCTLSGNGAGGYSSTLNNCIAYFNRSLNYDSASSLNYCCTTPLPANGIGNISADPQLASLSHLSGGSPCRGAGSATYTSGTDIDGEAWISPPSMGCDEYHTGTVTGPLSADITATFTNVVVGFEVGLTALIQGRTTVSFWSFGDGTIAIDSPYTAHAWATPGDYPVALWGFNESHPGGVMAAPPLLGPPAPAGGDQPAPPPEPPLISAVHPAATNAAASSTEKLHRVLNVVAFMYRVPVGARGCPRVSGRQGRAWRSEP